ncbi:unnamed protein product [Camellia sinensis]
MSTLDVARTELALVVLYLNKAEARDKICRAIQYGSKYLSNGEPGTAQNVDKSTSLARKVFRLFKFVNDLHALISPTATGTPLPLVLLGKVQNGQMEYIQNKERAEIIGRISLYCWMGSSICTTLVETWPYFVVKLYTRPITSIKLHLSRMDCMIVEKVPKGGIKRYRIELTSKVLGELGRLSASMKKLEKDLKNSDKHKNEQYRSKLQKSNERSLALVKAGMDIVVAVGLLQLAPKNVNPRVTGAFGFISSLISCYQRCFHHHLRPRHPEEGGYILDKTSMTFE